MFLHQNSILANFICNPPRIETIYLNNIIFIATTLTPLIIATLPQITTPRDFYRPHFFASFHDKLRENWIYGIQEKTNTNQNNDLFLNCIRTLREQAQWISSALFFQALVFGMRSSRGCCLCKQIGTAERFNYVYIHLQVRELPRIYEMMNQ